MPFDFFCILLYMIYFYVNIFLICKISSSYCAWCQCISRIVCFCSGSIFMSTFWVVGGLCAGEQIPLTENRGWELIRSFFNGGKNGSMIGYNFPECTSSYVLTESLEQIRISAYTLEFILCDIKHVSYIFIFAVALNFLSYSSCSFLIDPIFLVSQYSFLSLHALCSVAPSWKDCLSLISHFDVFKKTFHCDVTGLQGNGTCFSSIFIERKKTKGIDAQLHYFHPI